MTATDRDGLSGQSYPSSIRDLRLIREDGDGQ